MQGLGLKGYGPLVLQSVRRNMPIVLLGIFIYALGQTLLETGIISRYYYLALVQICVFAIAAVSLNLINGITGQFSLGHAAFMAVGGYIAAILTRDFETPFALALIAGGISAGVLGVLIGIPTLRLKGDYLAIATLGMGEIVRVVFENVQSVGGASGMVGIKKQAPLLGIGNAHFAMWGWAILCTVITIICLRNLINSSHGRALISIREDEIAAETMGINIVKYKVLAFVTGAFFAGVAGGLLVHLIRTIKPDSAGFLKSVEVLVIVVLGGLGSMTGAIVAAVILTMVSFLSSSLSSDLAAMRMVIYAVILVVLMLFRPQGLFGTKELTAKFFARFQGRKEENVRDTLKG